MLFKIMGYLEEGIVFSFCFFIIFSYIKKHLSFCLEWVTFSISKGTFTYVLSLSKHKVFMNQKFLEILLSKNKKFFKLKKKKKNQLGVFINCSFNVVWPPPPPPPKKRYCTLFRDWMFYRQIIFVSVVLVKTIPRWR